MWRRFEAEGAEWEVRSIPAEAHGAGQSDDAGRQMLEFRSNDANRPPRRLVTDASVLDDMGEDELRSALRQARPIGADYYGRPGKKMGDVASS